MDFSDTPKEAEFRAEAVAWLDANAEKRSQNESDGGILAQLNREDGNEFVAAAKKWQKKKADAGWACITWPEKYGGRGAAGILAAIWNQEESKYDVPVGIFTIGQNMAGPTLMAHAGDDVKDRFLPKLLTGEEIWCQLFSEPSAGSDLAGMRTSAVQDGNDWVVNGQKVWTTGAHFSDWGILVVRTDPTVPKHKGLTYFYVDMKAPGVEVRPIKQITGGADFNEVFFTDVRIPDSQRLSPVNSGWSVALTTLMHERMALAGGGLKLFDMNELVSLATQCTIDGKLAIENGAIRQRLASLIMRSSGLDYTSLRMLTALSKGAIPGPEGSIGKPVATTIMQDTAELALELQGLSGASLDSNVMMHGGLWQLLMLGTPGIRVAGGTDEILKNIIGDRVLGLPAEQRADKGIAFQDIPTGPAR